VSGYPLNSAQLAAASHSGSHAVVLAGPGTGKTRALVGRVLNLVVAGESPQSLFICTFTNKAAQEMRLRIGSALKGGDIKVNVGSMWIGTFHSLCSRILRQWHDTVGLSKDFEVIDVQGQVNLLDEAGVHWLDDKAILAEMIGRWKDTMVRPAEAEAQARLPEEHDAARAYAAYEEIKESRDVCDFADLISIVVAALGTEDHAIRDFVHSKFRHFLIDEFQDVNALQVSFLQQAVEGGGRIWAVGDDDQSLYGWRGADVRYCVRFPNYFGKAQRYILDKNYRSPALVLDAASAMIAHNTERVRKSLVPMVRPSPQNRISIHQFETSRDEADWIAGGVKHLVDKGLEPQKIAVVFRTAALIPGIYGALAELGIAAEVVGMPPFWELPEASLFVGGLRWLENPKRTDLAGAALPSERVLRDLQPAAQDGNLKAVAAGMRKIVQEAAPRGQGADRTGAWIDTAAELSQMLLAKGSIRAFLAFVEQGIRRDEEDLPRVILATIHAAKGLEWQAVFVAGCEAQMLPHHKSNDFEEERRLAYVAMTRTRGSLVMSYARNRFGKTQIPSPFLFEFATADIRAPGEIVWPNRPAKPVTISDIQESRG